MRAFWFSAAAALVALVGSAVLLLEEGSEAGAQTTVPLAIGDDWFCNSGFANGRCDTNISAGDTVVWTNSGSNSHTVTECGDSFAPCPQPGGFDSGLPAMTNGQTFSQTFSAPGTYEYFCLIHGSSMQGRVIVAAAQQAPSPTPAATTAAPSGSPTAAPTGAGPAVSPTPSSVPAAAPQTGGTPSGDDASWAWLVVAIGGAVLVASAATAVNVLRMR